MQSQGKGAQHALLCCTAARSANDEYHNKGFSASEVVMYQKQQYNQNVKILELVNCWPRCEEERRGDCCALREPLEQLGSVRVKSLFWVLQLLNKLQQRFLSKSNTRAVAGLTHRYGTISACPAPSSVSAALVHCWEGNYWLRQSPGGHGSVLRQLQQFPMIKAIWRGWEKQPMVYETLLEVTPEDERWWWL